MITLNLSSLSKNIQSLLVKLKFNCKQARNILNIQKIGIGREQLFQQL